VLKQKYYNSLPTLLIAIILVIAFLVPTGSAFAKSKTKTATVDIDSGVLNVRSGPSTKYKVIGTLKNKVKITVYTETKNGWAETRVNKKKGYVSKEFLRFYKKMSNAKAKKITDKALKVQRRISFNGSYTKKQIHSMLSESFTKNYIDKIIKYDLAVYEKNYKGENMYGWVGTDMPLYALSGFEWKKRNEIDFVVTELPKVVYYTKNGKEYLQVKQKIEPAFGTIYENIHLSKSSSKADWKVYK